MYNLVPVITLKYKALVEKVFSASDFTSTGSITRQQLRNSIQHDHIESAILFKEPHRIYMSGEIYSCIEAF